MKKHKIKFLGVLKAIAVVFFVSVFFAAQDSYAVGSITVSMDSSTLALDLLPNSADGTFSGSSEITVGVEFTGPGGYTLGIKANSSGSGATDLINSVESTAFTSISSAVSALNYADNDYAETNNLNNTWGYLPSKLNSADNSNYQPAPDANGDTIDVNSATNATGEYTIAIGARADLTMKLGTYTNTFVITAISNYSCNSSATSIDMVRCMQDFNGGNNDAIINSMVVGRQYQVFDNRDWKQYYIAKMADGRVWMTQNLDLDLETTPTNVEALTSENTNLTTAYAQNGSTLLPGYTVTDGVITWAPSVATVNTTGTGTWSTTTSTGASNANTLPQSFDYGGYYYYTDTSGSNQTFSTESACTTEHNDGTCAHYHTGNYYDWTAAVAMNSTNSTSYGGVDDRYYSTAYFTAPNSICPAGWRLPQGRTNATSTNVGYYSELNYTWFAQGIMTNLVNQNSNGTYATNGYINVSNAPMYMARTGYKNNTSNPGSMGSGYYWTSTVYNNSYAYSGYFQYSYPYPLYYSFNRYYGMPVRCVAVPSANTGSTVITFDANASSTTTGVATGTTANKTISAGTLSNLTANGYSISGYAFNSWNTKADGTGASYANAAQYYAAVGTATTNVTLYAQWDKTYTITFALSNATSVSFDGTAYTNGQTVQVVDGTTHNISGNYAKKYGFSSWAATAGTLGGQIPGTTYTVTGNATITLTGQEATTNISTLSPSGNTPSSSCKNEAITPQLVYDPRDNEAYYVAELCDGKIWMLDNLRLDLSKALDSYGGDDKITLSTTNTNASAQALSCLLTGSYEGNTCTGSYSTAAVQTKTLSGGSWSNSYNLPYIATSGTCANASYCAHDPSTNQWTADSISPITYGPGSGKIGVYYNYCAASAGSYCYASNTQTTDPNTTTYPTARDIESDICPAGWHIPTSGSYNATTGGGDYRNLYNKYGSHALFTSTLSTPLSGLFDNGSADLQGSNGYFWSSTWYNALNMYILRVGSSYVNPSGGGNRSIGSSVRCVLGS